MKKEDLPQPRPGRNNKPFDGLTVDLGKEVVYQSMPAFELKISKLEILKIEDNSNDKTVTVYLKNPNKSVILWEGKAYDEIGQWTDNDVSDRLKEIFKSK